MADDNKTPEEPVRSTANPKDREALKRAADDLLKKGGKSASGEKSAWANGTAEDDGTYGPDVTDEDAFRALADTGVTIYVGEPEETAAQYLLDTPDSVGTFLEKLTGEAGG